MNNGNQFYQPAQQSGYDQYQSNGHQNQYQNNSGTPNAYSNGHNSNQRNQPQQQSTDWWGSN